MVPQQNSPESESRTLSPEVIVQLEHALRALRRGDSQSPELLHSAVHAAASDARSQSLTAEELLLAFKAIEARTAPPRSPAPEHDRARTQVIGALLEAYYRS